MKRAEDEERLEKIIKKSTNMQLEIHEVKYQKGGLSTKGDKENGPNIYVYLKHRSITSVFIE